MSEETKQYLAVVLLVIIFNMPLAYIALVYWLPQHSEAEVMGRGKDW